MDRAQGLSNVRLFHMRPCGDFVRRYLAPGMEQHVKCSTAVFLRDKTVRERARAILEIAHPDFVNELLRDGRRLNLLS